MLSNVTILLLLLVVLCICLPGNGVYAFGAGNIPSFAYLEGKAFRHGDIEDALSQIAKKGAAGFSLGSLVGKGSKFGGLDIKRVYFGNWLRDYSQAVDVGSLKKLQIQTILNLCMALGFLAHGYATHEFEVTAERLGCYLPTEHIDNPKGYADGEDARKYHPQLRGPVDPRELEIDPQTGMKNYIANENGSWDTSKTLVRRTLERCIRLGRQHRAQGMKQDEYEAYRLLGQSLHTLEDFTAHSNFCELVLASTGHNVFVHVGDQVRIQTSHGKQVAPLVTGTFGSSDFIHSLLGEATDHISEASVTDLNKELNKARVRSRSGVGGGASVVDSLRDLLLQIPGGSGTEMSREMDSIERIRAGPAAGGKRPEDMSPQELHAVLWQVLSFRDSVMKKIEKTIEKIPGLGPLIERLSDSISVFVFSTLEPFLKPILQTATTGLQTASGEVINNHDQYEVFNDPLASDPTHSFLSKDHFNLILNEPAGEIARVVVGYTVRLIVKAWDDTSLNVHQITEDILSCLFHPDFHNPNSAIQREMLQCMQAWVHGLGNNQHEIMSRLSKESVRNHTNIRLAGQGGQAAAVGGVAWNAGVNAQHDIQGYIHGIPGVSQVQSIYNTFSGGTGLKRDAPGMVGQGGSLDGQGSFAPPPSAPLSSHGSGQAVSYYTAGASSGEQPMPPPAIRHGSRPVFPSAPSVPAAAHSSYNAPADTGLSFPSFPSVPPSMPKEDGHGLYGGHGHRHDPHSHHAAHGYSPSYASPPPGPPPSFPPGGGMVGGSAYGASSFSFPSPDQQGPGYYGGGPPSVLPLGGSSYGPPPGPPGGLGSEFHGGGSPYAPPAGPPGGFYNNPPPPNPYGGGW